MNIIRESKDDPNVFNVVRKHNERAELGLNKYNVTTRDNNLTLLRWLQHHQEELMDAAVYNEQIQYRIKRVEQLVLNGDMYGHQELLKLLREELRI